MIDFDIDPEKLAKIRSSRKVTLPTESTGTPNPPAARVPTKRGPGRPRKVIAPADTGRGWNPEQDQVGVDIAPPAPLVTVDEKQFAIRLQNLFTGVTGIGGAFVKPYMAMTDEEAEDIAVPLASYLVRRAPDSEQIREFIENYDLLSVVVGTASYAGRVYKDRRVEVEDQRVAARSILRSPSNSASAGVSTEPAAFDAGPEMAPISPIRTTAGPELRIDGQP